MPVRWFSIWHGALLVLIAAVTLGDGTHALFASHAGDHKIVCANYGLFDRAGNYQYRAFGVPGLGFRRGLADEIRYSILPVLIGDGVPFFDKLGGDIALHLAEVKAYKTGVVELRTKCDDVLAILRAPPNKSVKLPRRFHSGMPGANCE